MQKIQNKQPKPSYSISLNCSGSDFNILKTLQNKNKIKKKSHTGEEAERDVSFQNMSKKERDSSEVEARAVQICKP